jgi:hypothetical protein
MKYRHQRMVHAREERNRQRVERQQEVEALLRTSLTEVERRQWHFLSDALGRVDPT